MAGFELAVTTSGRPSPLTSPTAMPDRGIRIAADIRSAVEVSVAIVEVDLVRSREVAHHQIQIVVTIHILEHHGLR